MNDNERKLDKLQKLAELLRDDTITPSQAKQLVELLVSLNRQQKDELVKSFDNFTVESYAKIQEAISTVSQKHADALLEVRQLTNKQRKEHQNRIDELQSLLDEMRSIEIRDGVDGENGIDGYTPIKGVDYFDGSPDTRLQIVEKINTGKKNDEKIDASQIKNLPQSVQTIVERAGGFIETPLKAGANITITKDASGAHVITGTGSSGSGGTWGTITGTLSNQTDLQTALDGKQATITGLTASGAELNILDGATLTTTELNYVDGVTSAIQTQLDNKQPLDTQLTSLAGLAYTGNALKVVQVNAGETGFELATISAVTGSGTTNYIPKWTGSTALGNSLIYDNGTNVGIGTTSPNGVLSIAGNRTASAWGTAGINFQTAAATYTDSSSTGTVTNNMVNSFGVPTLAASSATTYTNAATLYVGAPTAGTNVTITNPYSIYANSPAYIGGISIGNISSLLQVTGSLTAGIYFSNTSATGPAIVSNANNSIRVDNTGIRISNNSTALQRVLITGSSLSTENGYGYNLGLTIGADGTDAMKIFTGGNITLQSGGTYTNNGYKLEVLSSGTAQTASDRVASFSNTGTTFNTSSGAISSYGGYFSSTSTRSAGANALTNIALYATASGAQNNYAAIFDGGDVGIGITTPGARLHVLSTTEQLRLGYDTTNYLSTTISSTGSATLALTGTSPTFTFSQDVTLPKLTTTSTIELGHASDTTLARVSAGVVSIGGVNIVTTSSTDTLSNKTLTAPKFADLGFIADANGNELMIFDTVASAVNEITLANAATATNPTITASGGDANVGIDISLKGTGTLNIKGNATQAAELRLYEDTDNGTNYSAFKTGAQASNITYTLPTTVGAAGTYLKDAAGDGVLSWAAAAGGEASLASGTGTDLDRKVYHEDFGEDSTGRFTRVVGGTGVCSYAATDFGGSISMSTATGSGQTTEWYADAGFKPASFSTIVMEFLVKCTDLPDGSLMDFAVGAGPTAGQYPGFENHSFSYAFSGAAWLFNTRSTTTQSDTGVTALTLNAIQRIRFEITGSGTTYKVFLNGTQLGTTHTTQVPTSTTELHPRVIFGNFGANTAACALNILQVRVVMIP